MITKFSCSCGNTNPAKTVTYDGALGYEAIVCTVCGNYHDHTREHQADEFSRELLAMQQPHIETPESMLELFEVQS